MNKRDRKIIFEKYGGKCAYCGCDLQKGWHVDEIEPIRRTWKYVNDKNGYSTKKVYTGCEHPDRLVIENQNPSCPSCNINKHSESLEQFRENIEGYMKHLNEISTQYKIAKRYGLVKETGVKVQFYFEKISNGDVAQRLA